MPRKRSVGQRKDRAVNWVVPAELDHLSVVHHTSSLSAWMNSSSCFRDRNSLRRGGLRAFGNWVQGLDLNQRPSGYEPNELPIRYLC